MFKIDLKYWKETNLYFIEKRYCIKGSLGVK